MLMCGGGGGALVYLPAPVCFFEVRCEECLGRGARRCCFRTAVLGGMWARLTTWLPPTCCNWIRLEPCRSWFAPCSLSHPPLPIVSEQQSFLAQLFEVWLVPQVPVFLVFF